ncbi:MAG: metallophosphoesterase [Thermoflexales bacterium]|nr:metallophosphoesterase [Thermoflexales bacterium]
MNTLTWLHLSDLHFRPSQSYNANIVLKSLLQDVKERLQDGLKPDLIVVTGDVAFSGQADEYQLAGEFFDALLKTTGLGRSRLFVVPGNHDVDRRLISFGAAAIGKSLTDRDKVNTLLDTPADRQLVMSRFNGYADWFTAFFAPKLSFDDERYFYVHKIKVGGKQLALLGLNSAWLCASDQDKAEGLLIGERQARAALEQAQGADLKIALLHHPFDWLRDFDQDDSATLLHNGCDFILHGHLHKNYATRLTTPDSTAMVLACGACYETRDFPNMINWVQIDPDDGTGTVHLRRYSDAQGGFWAKDTLTYRNAPDGKYDFSLRGQPFRASSPAGKSAPEDVARSQSGGVHVESQQATIQGDVVGGNKTEYHYHGSPPPSQAGGTPLDAPPSKYDLQAVRELLSAAFSDGDVVTLAFDRFRAVYEDISGGMGKSDKIRRLVDWCERHGSLETLLAEVKQRNPHQYARYAARVKSPLTRTAG